VRVLVTGANGQLGRALTAELIRRDINVTALVRDPAKAKQLTLLPHVTLERGDLLRPGPWSSALNDVNAVVHLAGELAHRGADISSHDARLDVAREVARAIGEAPSPPKLVIQASSLLAFGRAATCDEASPAGSDPVATAAVQAEGPLKAVSSDVVTLRFGQIIGPRLVYEARHGAPLPDERAPLSWISLEDAVRMIAFLLKTPGVHGDFIGANSKPVDTARLRRELEPIAPKKGVLGALFARKKDARPPLPDFSGVSARPTRALALGLHFEEEALAPVVKAANKGH
jgi:NAD dependent epimerase/dehydratase family enzyme